MTTIIEPFDQLVRLMLTGSVPSNSAHSHTLSSPYRSELAGLYAGFEIIQRLEQLTGTATHIEVSCDNDEALRVGSSS